MSTQLTCQLFYDVGITVRVASVVGWLVDN